MSVDQLTSRRVPRPAGDSKLVEYDQYIDTHIRNTRRAVKAVDWATALVLLGIGVLAFLFTAAVVEHWLVPGGFPVAVRVVLFMMLLSGVGYFACRRLWPLCRRAINPVYAAQTIERSSPTLKNSLINLLLFRQHRAEISDAVYQTLEEQAAHRLTRVPVDAAVDRTHLIRFGYVLIAVVAITGLYKVLSPKDPWIAAERILMPWSDTVPASRVSIRDVEPGSITVARGEFIDVSVEIRGLRETDAVLLRYTTADGQAVDKPIEMKLGDDGLRFKGRLPDDFGSATKVGVAQNLHYRIEAGDARSRDYAVTVVPAPSILVDRVEYDYPEYTGFLDRQVEDLGDIRAIEGTQITIHARANGPIREAHVDFDADGRNDLKMTASGGQAHASFVLGLREDRQTPNHASYVLRFTNTEDRPNRSPVKHPIVVDPDIAPEVAVLLPKEKAVDVRLNDTVAIEIEAADPDFGLAEVRLRGEAAGRAVFDERLLNGRHTGRFTGRYQFRPSAHGLKAGDVVQYWVAANDVRAPKPNTAESERRLIRIASPDPAQQPLPDRLAQRDPRQQQRNQQQPNEQRQQPGEQQQEPANQQQQPGAQQPQDGGQQRDGEDQQLSRDAQRSAEPGQSGNEQQGEQQQPGQQNSDGEPGQQGEQTGAGAAGGDASQQGAQPDGTRPDEPNAKPPQDGGSQNGGNSANQSREPDPVSADGDNDAEAFERIQRHLERNGELNDSESQPGDHEISRDAQPSAEQQPSSRDAQQNAEKDQRQGDSLNQPNDGAKNAPNRESQPGAKDSATSRQQQDSASEQPGARANDQADGTGAETRKYDRQGDKEQPGDDAKQSKSPGGQQTNSKGPSGAGHEQENQGAPNSDPNLKPTEKRQQSGSSPEQTDQHEPSAGARGKRESDSQGEEGGDKAGGGEEGGGQKSPREGTGSAGQNQSADEGAGESAEKGAGNTSPNAGDDAEAGRPTGKPGDETTGRGSRQRDGEGDKRGGAAGGEDTKGGETGAEDDPARAEKEAFSRDAQRSAEQQQRQGDKETGKQGEQTSSEARGDGERPPQQRGDEQRPSQTDDPQGTEPGEGTPRGDEQRGEPGERGDRQPGEPGRVSTGDGGETGTNTNPPPRSEGVVPEGDPANLEYARKQTDLVLEKLSDQLKKKRVDKSLLDQLGWTEEDMRKFVERWQQRKAAAQHNDPAGEEARRELDDALRSLGLRRGTLNENQAKDDTQRDLREGYRGPVPAKYQHRLRAYSQGVSRAQPDDE